MQNKRDEIKRLAREVAEDIHQIETSFDLENNDIEPSAKDLQSLQNSLLGVMSSPKFQALTNHWFQKPDKEQTAKELRLRREAELLSGTHEDKKLREEAMNYKLTPMTAEHIPQIAALERVCFSHPWSEDMLREGLWNESAVIIVAEGEDGTVLGYAGLQTVLDEGYINNVAVDEQFRRQGVADELISAFVRFGQAKLAFLTLEVRASNEPAIALYKKHGFSEVGRRTNYYDDPKEDAILMTLEF